MKTSYKEFIDESSLSRIHSKLQSHAAGAVTGYRGENTREKNQSNNRDIMAYLKSKGYSVTKVKGSYIENKGSATEREVGEPSFFVVNYKVDGDDKGQLEKDLILLGKRFDQDSILSVRHGQKAVLIGTSKRPDGWPELGQKFEVGSGKFGKASGEFLSRVRGREFAFEHVAFPGTINGIRGWKELATMIEAEEGIGGA